MPLSPKPLPILVSAAIMVMSLVCALHVQLPESGASELSSSPAAQTLIFTAEAPR